MTYFGWRDLIQIWYLLEPALFCAGFVMLIRIALDLWENIAYADLTYGPIRTRREGFNFFFASFFLMFCNPGRSEEHTSELRHTVISYAVFCLKKKNKKTKQKI